MRSEDPSVKASFVAIGKLIKLSAGRLFAKGRKKSLLRNRCELCCRRGEHTHPNYDSYYDGIKLDITYADELRNALEHYFAGIFVVSSPRFGGTINIAYRGGSCFVPDLTPEVRYFLSRVCGLEVLKETAASRKVAATIKI